MEWHVSALPNKAKRQYLFTLHVSIYCLFALQSSVVSMLIGRSVQAATIKYSNLRPCIWALNYSRGRSVLFRCHEEVSDCFLSPAQRIGGRGLYASHSRSVLLSVRLSAFSFSERISETHVVDFIHITHKHTHQLGGVDMPFGSYDLWLTALNQNNLLTILWLRIISLKLMGDFFHNEWIN